MDSITLNHKICFAYGIDYLQLHYRYSIHWITSMIAVCPIVIKPISGRCRFLNYSKVRTNVMYE